MSELTASRLDTHLQYDLSNMFKLGYVDSLSSLPCPAQVDFLKLVSETYNYLVQSGIQSPRYTLSTGHQLSSPQDSKVCEYFYELSCPEEGFTKNYPSFFRFYDYLESRTSADLSSDETYQIARRCIKRFPVPDYTIYTGISAIDISGNAISCPDISTCYSPVMLDRHNAKWYKSLWNSLFESATRVNLFDDYLIGDDYWKVSSPIVNMAEYGFQSLKDRSFEPLSDYMLSDDMACEYEMRSESSAVISYPVTRYCQNYDKLMIQDRLNRRATLSVEEWEEQNMSQPFKNFWKPVAEHFRQDLSSFPVAEYDLCANNFIDLDYDYENAVGMQNTIDVGLDWKQWILSGDHLSSFPISSFSWITRPYRITQTEEGFYPEGQQLFQSYFSDMSRYIQENYKPNVYPPKKVVIQNILALAYYWTKFLSTKDVLGNYVSHATANQHIPYNLIGREQDIGVHWMAEPQVETTGATYDLSIEIGKMKVTQSVTSSDTGWTLSSQHQNFFCYDKKPNITRTGEQPKVYDLFSIDYGDISGFVTPEQEPYPVYINYDPQDVEQKNYYDQLKQLYPRSRGQQKQDDLEDLSSIYEPQISALEEEILSAQQELSALEIYKEVTLNELYRDAYDYAWENTYGDDYQQETLSGFFNWIETVPPYGNVVSGDFQYIYECPFEQYIIDDVNDYKKDQEDLSAYPNVSSFVEFKDFYNGVILNVPLSAQHETRLANDCRNIQNEVIVEVVDEFIESKPDESQTVWFDFVDFGNRLLFVNGAVGAVWNLWFQQFITENEEEYLAYYYTRKQICEEVLARAVPELEALEEEYEEKIQEIEQKHYDIILPDFIVLSSLYQLYKYPYPSIVEGEGHNHTIRKAKVKCGTDEGITQQQEEYDGLTYRYPYSFEDEENEAVGSNSYLMYYRHTKFDNPIELSVPTEEIRPLVGQYNSYDEFRRTKVTYIDTEAKNTVGYDTKGNWWGGEYNQSELNPYIINDLVDMSYVVSNPFHPPVVDLSGAFIVEVQDQEGHTLDRYEAELVKVLDWINADGYTQRYDLEGDIVYDAPIKFGEPVTPKMTQRKTLSVDFPSPIMCQTSWKCSETQ